MNLCSTPTPSAHRWVIGMDNVRRACWRPQSGLVTAAIFASLFFAFVEPVRANVVVTPTELTIGIPTGQTTAWGSITARNTGVAPVTITWSDGVNCLQNLTPLTRTLAAGSSSVFTIEGVCPATGSATLSGTGVSMVTIPVSISTVPAVGLSPTSLVFAGTVGGTNSSAQTFAISNIGGGTLTWSASSSVTWLTLSPQSGTNAGTITASLNPAGLVMSGNYTATVTVTAVGATTKTMPVTLTVTTATSSTGAGFSISPPTLSYTATVGSPNKTSGVTITNTGTSTFTVTWFDPINWLVATSGDTVTMAPGGSATISHTASAAGLTAGSYSGTATIAGGGITQQVPVTLTVVTSTAQTANLTWNANSETDLSGYKVYARTSSGAYAAPVATIPKGTTSYTATGLQTGTTYFFIVTAYDNAGNESLHSSEVSKSIF
ncbi:hypothetical protein AYO43_04390 [Nitrospira sp. SCGC AG-212-E16]|nr:hypothetical protein AYO43_04390 [Nitrospira sp. SCGC AG-212-E16]